MALKVRRYDLRGTYRGQKATYSGANTAGVSGASGGGIIAALGASTTKTIRLQRVVFSATVASAAIYVGLTLRKTSTLTSGGTPATLTQTPFVSTSAAGTAALCNTYSAAPTGGTLVGTLSTQQVFLPLTGTPALGITPVVFDFANEWEMETTTVVAGSTQGIELVISSPGNVPTLAVTWIWTEE